MARNIVLTDIGGAVKWEETVNGVPTVCTLPKTGSAVQRENDDFKIHVLDGFRQMGTFTKDDFDGTPYADADALEAALLSFFGLSSYTASELSDAITSGILPAGRWVFVSNLSGTHEGGWLFCSTTSTVAAGGFGNYLDAPWSTVGDTSAIEAFTGRTYTVTKSLWRANAEKFTIEFSNVNVVGDGFIVGGQVQDDSGWQGVILATDGTTYMDVYSVAGNLATQGDTLTDLNGTTADLDTAGTKADNGYLVCYIDETKLNLGYEAYQCIDNTLLDGTGPILNTDAYIRLPRFRYQITWENIAGGVFVAGDDLDDGTSTFKVLSVDGDTAIVTPNSATYRFPQASSTLTCGGVTADYLSHGAELGGFGYAKQSRDIEIETLSLSVARRKDPYIDMVNTAGNLGLFESVPWGFSGITSLKIENNGDFRYYNQLAGSIGIVVVANGGTFGAGNQTVTSESNIYNVTIERLSNFGVSLEDNATFQDCKVLAGVGYSGKTISAGAIVTGGVISQSDSTTENVTVGQFDNLGWRYKEVDIVPDQLKCLGDYEFTNNIAEGIELLPTTADYYKAWRIVFEKTNVAPDPYTSGPTGLLIVGTVSGNAFCKISPSLVTVTANVVATAENSIKGGITGGNSVQYAVLNDGLTLKGETAVAFEDGNSPILAKIWYLTETFTV